MAARTLPLLCLLLALGALAAPAAAARHLSAAGHRSLLATCSNNCIGGSMAWCNLNYSDYANLVSPLDTCDGQNTPCGSCSLYRRFCQPAQAAHSPWAYTASPRSSQPDLSQPHTDHVLVLPGRGCRGVEEWRTNPACHGENIWDAAWDLLKTGQLKGAKAMAVNSSRKRTQHQMHVHVADVDLAIHGFLSQVPVGAQGWTYTTCQAHGVPGTLRCGPGTAVQPHAVTIAAKCVAAAAPSQAKPFHTVYESGYPDAVRNSVTLVHSPRKGVVCVLEARDRPVECLLHCKDECQTKIGKYCP